MQFVLEICHNVAHLPAFDALYLCPEENAGRSGEVVRSLKELGQALETTFWWYATFVHALYIRLWTSMSGRWRALLGVLECLYLLLALVGVTALGSVRRIFKRLL